MAYLSKPFVRINWDVFSKLCRRYRWGIVKADGIDAHVWTKKYPIGFADRVFGLK